MLPTEVEYGFTGEPTGALSLEVREFRSAWAGAHAGLSGQHVGSVLYVGKGG